MRIAFIIHSKSAKARNSFAEISSQIIHEHVAFHTTGIGSAHEIALGCIKEGYTHLAVLGGDGTLNEVFNGMIQSGKNADELPILCIHPCGTGNDFARNLNLSEKSEAFLRRLNEGSVQYSDGGVVQYTNLIGRVEMRYFINAMDVGLGGLISQRVNQYRRGRLAFLSYQRGILRTIPFYFKTYMTVKTEEHIYSGPAMSVVVANGKWFGNGLGIAPHADVSDGVLNCVILGRVNLWDYMLNLHSIIRCRPIQHKEIHYKAANEIEIKGEPSPLELDGEYVGFSPASIRVIPRAIRLLAG
jgi:YegS/Rv2252/BmrU family lipid kinase